MSARGRGRGRGLIAAWLVCAVACASEETRLRRASNDLAEAIEGGDDEALDAAILAGQRSRLDRSFSSDEAAREELAAALADPVASEATAILTMGEGDAVEALALPEGGWAFASDPSDYYGQATPREALRSFVRASRLGRWDVLLRLAPRRYRMGLSEADLELAWTNGEAAALLAERRDRLADRIDAAIRSDAHQAIVALGDHHFARLEREGERWVVVDF